MAEEMKMDKSQSAPALREASGSEASGTEPDTRRVKSLSLSHLRKNSDFADYKPSPFNIRWMHGYNPNVGVINLNDRGSTVVFYAAANCGVLYNWTTNQMKILQGHLIVRFTFKEEFSTANAIHDTMSQFVLIKCNNLKKHTVAYLASDAQGKWLVTADSGPENILIIWDSSDYIPQKTIFLPHKETRLAKLALSADAKYLITLGYQDKALIYWWIWSFGLDEPHAKLAVEVSKDSVLAMEFNPYNSEQFVLMTKHDIWIGVSRKVFIFERGVQKETEDYELKIRKPENYMTSEMGRFICFTIVKNTSQILVGTSRGAVYVYGYTIEYKEQVDSSDYENLRFIKSFKLEKAKINVIKSVDGIIVTGSNSGEIHFYDEHMKLLYWIHGFIVDTVRGLSFNISPRSYEIFDPKCNKKCPCWENVVMDVDPETGISRQKLIKKKIPSDATIAGKPLIVRDFIVCTKNEGIRFVDYVTERNHIILDSKPSHVLSLSVHPEKPFVCMGYADGIIELFNFVLHKLFVRIDLREHYKVVIPPKDDSITCIYQVTLPEMSVTCLKYSPSGMHLACGLHTGQIIFLDPITIRILTKPPFKDTSYPIKEINFSLDSLTMAFSDTGRTVGVYKYDCTNFTWIFVGKHRAHYKDITAVFFLTEKNDDGEFKLLSLGADRSMVEYDIGRSSNEYLEVHSLDRMEQVAIPLAGIPWPAPHNLDQEEFRVNLPMILVANDEFKYKIVNYATTMTLATILGPRYEHPVSKMQLITRREGTEEFHYLLFVAKNVIGLQKMPLDGNPWKHIGLLGHPLQIAAMCFREDIGTLFTIGQKDNVMCQWTANYRSVDTTTQKGGVELDPYYCLVENGRPGWLFQEIRDQFYYIQILCQGTFTPAVRRVKDYIPIDSLPDLMRALGFFPTEYEVENLIVEAKYKVYQQKPSTEVDFEEFVKLYLNHRPAFGDNYARLRSAFRTFATIANDSLQITRDDFIDILSQYGECFPSNLSWYLLSILSGDSFEDRESLDENEFSFLPEVISFSHLVTYLFGIQEMDNMSEQTSMKNSSGSHFTTSSMDSEENRTNM